MRLVILLMAVAVVVLAFEPQPELQKNSSRLQQAVDRALNWNAFWKRGDGLSSAVGGDSTATVIDAGTRVVIFIERLHLALTFFRRNDELIGGLARSMNGDRDSNVRSLVESLRPGEFRLKSAAPKVTMETPKMKSREQRHITVSTINLELHPPTGPFALSHRIRPDDLPDVVATAMTEALKIQPTGCRRLTLTIPYYATNDPQVYAFVDFGEACGSGVLPIVNGAAGWRPGTFSAARPPNEWSKEIALIRSYRLVTVQLF